MQSSLGHPIVVLAQMNSHVGNLEKNAAIIRRYIAQARDELGAELLIFPELALTGYPPEDFLLHEDFLHAQNEILKSLAQETLNQKLAIIIGHPHLEKNKRYNAATLLRQGQCEASYYKQMLPNDHEFNEKRYFVPGTQATVFEHAGLRWGLSICEDIWTPHVIAETKQAGAELIITLNASPFHLHKMEERKNVLQQRVQESGLPIFYAQRTGGQDDLLFDGGSMVWNSDALLSAQAPQFQEGLLVISLPNQTSTFIPDSTYAPLPHFKTQDSEANILYQALCLGVRDYCHKNHYEKVLLGLSGGIDSALTLAIAVDTLGAENVQAVMMPSRFTSALSLEIAAAQAECLNVSYRIIDIEPTLETYLHSLKQANVTLTGLALENIQARCRAGFLLAISNQENRLILNTSNKSELAMGYGTLYGDMIGGFAALKDVSKTWVYRLAHARNSNGVTVIPEKVLTRAPTAELAPNQTDQDSLPPYERLDDILARYIEAGETAEQIIAAGFSAQEVHDILQRLHRHEYKRRQAPIGSKVTRRSFGREWRYPIST